jgi:hypothetical protein
VAYHFFVAEQFTCEDEDPNNNNNNNNSTRNLVSQPMGDADPEGGRDRLTIIIAPSQDWKHKPRAFERPPPMVMNMQDG